MDRYKLVNLTNTRKDPRRKRRCKLTQSPLRLGRKLVPPGTSIKITRDQYKQHKKIIDAYIANAVFEFVPINETQKVSWEKLIATPVAPPKVVAPEVVKPPVKIALAPKIKISEPVIEVIEEPKIEVLSIAADPEPAPEPAPRKTTPSKSSKKTTPKKEEPRSTKKTYNRSKTSSSIKPSTKKGTSSTKITKTEK